MEKALKPLEPFTARDIQQKLWDVVVIGAGVAGSVAALQAARLGMQVLLIDKRRFPRRKVCGACLNNLALGVLRQLGLTKVVQGLGGTDINDFSFHVGRQVLHVPLPGGIAVSREALDDALVKEAISAGVWFLPEKLAKLGPLVGDCREVTIQQEGTEISVRGRCVIVASGLESVGPTESSEWKTEVVASSRVGVGCLIDEPEGHFANGTIWMGAGAGGYAGLVRVEGGRLNIAAALDRDFLRQQRSPATAIRAILEQSKMPVPASLMAAEWQGTLQLTRTTRPVASDRVFLIGDAAGYVEPFTGEGMAWGLLTAQQVMPWIQQAVARTDWSPQVGQGWEQEYQTLIAHRQNLCQRFAWFLRSPTLLSTSLFVATVWPGFAKLLVNRLNAAPNLTPQR
ncbi:FAD-dependent oxidoreductase [Schlesneria sp. T3-172]|uniref:NAD(P)/FAD-dependent oxidoreductase n=1 Tax=Schlesneria sphaerica TaxID=3373610 RepID=UPI0037CB90C0